MPKYKTFDTLDATKNFVFGSDKFKFVHSSNRQLIYTAERDPSFFGKINVSWIDHDADTSTDTSTEYRTTNVIEYIFDGHWKVFDDEN